MPLYRYLASENGSSSPRELLVEADSRQDALARLRSRGTVPVRFLGEETRGRKELFSLKRNRIDTFQFTRQISPLLDSYIPLEKALSILGEAAEDPEQKEFIAALRRGLHEGKKFSELIRSYGELFPGYYANLVESGEETGCLPEVMKQLLAFMTEARERKDFLISSSIYPMVILGVTVGVTVLLFTVVVPRFAGIFRNMGRAMPASMEFLTAAGNAASFAWWVIPLGIWLFLKLAKKSLGEEEFRRRRGALLLRIPVAGKIISSLEMCKYIRTLSILIGNHVEIIRTVRIAEKVVSNPVIAASLRGLGKKLKGGAKLSAALAGNRFLPAEMIPMLKVGEESGTVGEMLEKISANLEADTRTRIKRLLSLFEPAVIIFLAVTVLGVVVVIFAAMMDINSIGG